MTNEMQKPEAVIIPLEKRDVIELSGYPTETERI